MSHRLALRAATRPPSPAAAKPVAAIFKTDKSKIVHTPKTARSKGKKPERQKEVKLKSSQPKAKDSQPKDSQSVAHAVLYLCATKGGLDVTDQEYRGMGQRERGAWASHYAGKAWTRQVHSVGAQLYPNMPVNEIDWSVYTDTGRTNVLRAVALNVGWQKEAYDELVMQDGELQPFVYPIGQTVVYVPPHPLHTVPCRAEA